MKSATIGIGLLLFSACAPPQDGKINGMPENTSQVEETALVIDPKVQVLNIGTFHMDYTTDGRSTEYDEHDQKNLQEIDDLVRAIARFKPNVILVEVPPKQQKELSDAYRDYCNKADPHSFYMGEIGLVAFAVGKQCGVERIYGIDHKMNYNFMIADQLVDQYPSAAYSLFRGSMDAKLDAFAGPDSLHLITRIANKNTKSYYDYMLNLNADMLTHLNSDTLFEGADEAALFYKRNLRMYANMNKLNLQVTDRVFVLMGAAHTSYFDMFMARSPMYNSVPALDYLKLPK